MPAVSVLLPVYNARPWLAASLRSLWRQTFADFEVVAVDDGSSDGSADLLERAARTESRLRIIRSAHVGLPGALNQALAHARGWLLARHDADDLSHRTRFENQVAHMRAHRSTAVVGSRLRLFPATSVGVGMRRWARWHNALLTHEDMAHEVFIDSPLAHGTAMLRRSWVQRVGGWHERGWAEDLDLWMRLLEAGARFHKLPEVLYGWRQHRGSATRRDPRYARKRFIDLKLAALSRGILKGKTGVTLVGVGTSLDRAEQAFGRLNIRVKRVERRRPGSREGLGTPIVLIFMSPVARARWRAALASQQLIEGHDFIFAV